MDDNVTIIRNDVHVQQKMTDYYESNFNKG